MAKHLKLYNGRGQGSKYVKGYFYIAAYTRKQAAELASMAGYGGRIGYVRTHEIKDYFLKEVGVIVWMVLFQQNHVCMEVKHIEEKL